MGTAIETRTLITDDGAREIARVVQGAGQALDVWDAALPTDGRPRRWTVRQMLTVFLLNAAAFNDFQLLRIPSLIAELSVRQRDILRLPGVQDDPVFSLRQLGRAWRLMSQAIDAYAPGLTDDERDDRDRAYQHVGLHLLTATIPVELFRNCGAHLAVDATKVASFGRPPHPARDAGLSETGDPRLGADGEEPDPNVLYAAAEASTPATFAPPPVVRVDEFTVSGRRRRSDVGRVPVGATWLGANKANGVYFGYQHHVGVLVSDADRSFPVPNLAVFCNTGPATANPAAMTIGQLAAYDQLRRRAGAAPLTEVLADGGYTGLRGFVGELKNRDIAVTFRLHGTNQQGVHGADAAVRRPTHKHQPTRPVIMIDGRPHCACAPDKNLSYPWNDKPELPAYWERLAWRTGWELRAMGATANGDGTRFRAPHHGRGCEYCDYLPADQRCCQQATHTISNDRLTLMQPERHGSPEWVQSYARRSRVESFFAGFKDHATSGVYRSNARFFEFGKTAFAALLRVAATNISRLAAWRRRQRQLGQIPDLSWMHPPLRTFMPATDPGTNEAKVAAGAPGRRSGLATRLEHLGHDDP